MEGEARFRHADDNTEELWRRRTAVVVWNGDIHICATIPPPTRLQNFLVFPNCRTPRGGRGGRCRAAVSRPWGLFWPPRRPGAAVWGRDTEPVVVGFSSPSPLENSAEHSLRAGS